MRNDLASLKGNLGNCHHPGLLMDRFYPGNEGREEGQAKTQHFQKLIQSSQKPEVFNLYKAAFERWKENLPTSPKKDGNLETSGRMVIGLGKASVLEIGIHLHHHLGFPFIPGSSIKGICAHYCSKVWGSGNEAFKSTTNKDKKISGEHHLFLFGDTSQAGAIRFEDTWWVPPDQPQSPFHMDIITPHHKDWQDEGKAAPTDFDSPTPVSFLSFSGKFHFCITWQGPEPVNDSEKSNIDQWLSLAWKLLTESLAEQGVGGKTSSGFGKFKKTTIATFAPKKPYNGEKFVCTVEKRMEKKRFKLKTFGIENVNIYLQGNQVPNNLPPGSEVTVQMVNAGKDTWIVGWVEPQPAK